MRQTIELIPTSPEGPPQGVREYRLRAEDGSTRLVRLDWSPPLLADLVATQAGDAEAGARLGEALAALLQGAWDGGALQAALERGEAAELLLQSDAREVYALPWELMPLKSGESAIAALEGLRLAYASPGVVPRPESPSPRPPGGRLLFAWSAAGGPVSPERHLEALAAAGVPAPEVLADASPDALHAALRPDHCALHLLAHGGPPGKKPGIWLDGAAEPVDPAALADLLRPRAGSLRLVALSACHSGDGGAIVSALGSPAWRLHKAGFEAVIASRFPLSVPGSVRFAALFWAAVLGGCADAGQALAAARGPLRRLGGLDYAALQLYGQSACRPFVFCPFPGLRPFSAGDARFFAGRSEEVEAVWRKLGAAQEAGRPRFVALPGTSGAGKTSLLQAGIGPRAAAEGQSTASVGASSDPLAEIRAARAQLLLVDEVEDMPAAPEVLRELWALSRGGPAVVVGLRLDALARLGGLLLEPDLRLDRLVFDERHSQHLAIPSRALLRETIEVPARRVGLEVEDGLIERILDEVGEEATALLLVQHVVEALWRRRAGSRLTHAAYEALGGVAGALSSEAERVAERIAAEGGESALRSVLLQLVQPGKDGAPDSRRRAPLQALRAEAVVEALQDAALVVVTGDRVELAHEALIRRWPRLRRWVDEHRARAAELEQIAAWVADFEAHQSLLDAGRLGYAEAVDSRYPGALDAAARALIDASRARLQAEAEAEQARQAALAVELARARDILRVHALGSFGEDATTRVALLRDMEMPERLPRFPEDALAALNGAPALAELRWPEPPYRVAAWSPDSARVALVGRELLAIGPADGRGDPELIRCEAPICALRWTAEALWAGTEQGAVLRLEGAAFAAVLPPLEGWPQAVALGAEAQAVLLDGRLRLRPYASGKLGAPVGPKDVAGLNWSPDGRRLLLSLGGGGFALLDGAGETLERLKAGRFEGAWLCDDGLWLLDQENQLHHDKRVFPLETRCYALAASGGWLAELSRGLRLWRKSGGGPVVELPDRPDWLLWSPDGQRLLTGELHGALRVFAPPPEAAAVELPGDAAGAVFSADGQRLAVWGGGGIRAWILESGGPRLLFQRAEPPGGAGEDLCFWSGERLLVREGPDALRAVWPPDPAFAAGDALVALLPGGLEARRFPDGAVALVGPDGVEKARAEGLGAPVRAAAFSADGSRLAVIDEGGDVRVWSADCERVAVGTPGHGKMAAMAGIGTGRASVAFTADGARLAVLTGACEVSVYPVGIGSPLRLSGRAPDLGTLTRKRSFVAQSTVETTARWLAVGFPDPTRLCVLDGNGTLRVFWVDADRERLRERLRAASTVTLRPKDRQAVFGESVAEAEARYAEDEARYGRSGAAPPETLLAMAY